MTGKECVRKVLSFQPTPYIPYGEYAIDSDTVEKILGHETYLRAKAKTQLALWDGRRDEVVQSLKEDFVALYQKLDFIDIINLISDACGMVPPKDYDPCKPKRIDENTWEDAQGCIYKYSPITRDITMIYDPMTWEREYDVDEFREEPLPKPVDESQFEVIDYIIPFFRETHYIISYAGAEAGMILLGGMERGLSEYISDPEVVQSAIDAETRRGCAEDEQYIRPGTDAIMWGQDFAYKEGSLINPKLFEQMILPSICTRVQNVKQRDIAVFKHCCGYTMQMADLFIRAGYDCYQSIQNLHEQNLAALKQIYGNKLALWGGVDVRTLISGTMEETRKETRLALETARQGGIILGSSHSIAVGCNYDNVMAMFDEIVRSR